MRARRTAVALLLAVGLLPTAHAWEEDGYCALAPSPLMSEATRDSLALDEAACSVPARAVDGTPLFEAPVDRDTAARALAQAYAFASARDFEQALLSLRIVEAYAPEMGDRWALARGHWLRALGRTREARAAFSLAEGSPDPGTALRGRMGDALTGLELGDRQAEHIITTLVSAHRDLADAAELRFALGKARALRHDRAGAVEVWRALDLENPGSLGANRARQELDALRAQDVVIAPFTLDEEIARVDRWVKSGPLAEARTELSRLEQLHAANAAVLERLAPIKARIIRFEGGLPPESSPDVPFEANRELASQAARNAIRARATASAATRRGMRRPSVSQLMTDLETAARNAWREECDLLLQTLGALRDFDPSMRIEAASLASGVATEAVVFGSVAPILDDARRGTAARFVQACSLERSGATAEARRAFEDVARTDRTELRWYAFWSRQHLRTLDAPEVLEPVTVPDGVAVDRNAPGAQPIENGKLIVVAPSEAPVPSSDQIAQSIPEDRESVQSLLRLARRHGTTYPWLARAARLVELHDLDAAADELHNVWLARRSAKGAPPHLGLEAVYRGVSPTSARPDRSKKAALLRLAGADLEALADVAEALGDPGLAVDFAGRSRLHGYPRAYEEHVLHAAETHGVDPALLWAVMRVESVYDRRIVSYAGAIGLMQIMPRTGKLIARALHREDFTVADLLEPETNIEFAAWYLRSLIDRFDGRVPLAVAAYNGGPHNVRRWISAHSAHVPLEAFMERIPFGQTWRYVRRVMGHYAEYKSRAGEDIPTLQRTLPGSVADDVGF